MISAQTLCVCREGKPVSTFPDHALDGVFRGFDRPRSHDLPCWFGLEHHFLAREGVGAFPRLGRWLLDHDELGKAWYEKYPGFLQFLVTYVGQGIHDVLHVTLRELGG